MTQTIDSSQMVQEGHALRSHRRQIIATLFGASSFEGINWQRLIQDGVVVRLHIRRCRFSTRLVLEDIGVHVDDDAVKEKLSEWLVLGEKRLLPVEYMKALSRIESSARHALKERSFRTELGAFVPSSAYVGWRDTTEGLKAQYEALRDDIIANHRALSQQVLTQYEVIAANTYQRLRGTHPELMTESQEHFVTNYCNRISAQIPSPDRIRDTFDFNYLLVNGLSELGATPLEAANAQDSSTTQAEPMVTVDVARPQVPQREWQRSVLDHDLRIHAQERISTALDSFLSSVVSHLRNLTYDVTCDVLSTLQRRSGERFAHQSVRQLTNLLTQMRELNFYGDTEIERMMDQIQQIVEQSPEERQQSIVDIQRTLRAIATVTRSTLLDLDEEPRVAREIAIPDLPTEASVRQARAELGLDLNTMQLATLSQIRADARAERAEASGNGMQSLWSYMQNEEHRGARTL
ncbi:hypothetical protein [Tengunoibacter tsumagoiensis]|uniref:Uncharacterized protein n=1 Tax=Tengunoibacter tsumagoiensis TaxID=2014871 RepID=A0A402A7G2_9CHLR|nr:hypothetical protein [Tengunoibacter tsumagoiensis]GCE15073.1 hypothetical protein KTT_49320 [Tengunoibacter tsumagoiensis]